MYTNSNHPNWCSRDHCSVAYEHPVWDPMTLTEDDWENLDWEDLVVHTSAPLTCRVFSGQLVCVIVQAENEPYPRVIIEAEDPGSDVGLTVEELDIVSTWLLDIRDLIILGSKMECLVGQR